MQRQRCHHCHYDLTGLQGRGTCPECGKPYNMGSIYRETRSDLNPLAQHAKPIMLACLALLILLCGGAVALGTSSIATALVTLVVAALPGFGAFVYWWSDRVERRDSE